MERFAVLSLPIVSLLRVSSSVAGKLLRTPETSATLMSDSSVAIATSEEISKFAGFWLQSDLPSETHVSEGKKLISQGRFM